jgi:Ca2+-binding RTX toxin-like protein
MRREIRTIAAAGCALAALAATGAPAAAKVTTTVTGSVLQIGGGNGAERVRVTCTAEGEVKVNGSNPKGGPVPCGRIVEVDAAMGGGSDRIDFSGITGAFGKARFPGFGVATGTAALGGPGNDRYIPSRAAFNLFFGEADDDRATGGPARDVLSGGAGEDKLNGAGGRDSVIGGAGGDRLLGAASSDLLSGGEGEDLLLGGPGADVLGGGTGRDRLRGGSGRDRLVGNGGRDSLSGGAGQDVEIEKNPK